MKLKDHLNLESYIRFLRVFYSRLPLLPTSLSKYIADAMPYISVAVSGFLLTGAILPYFFPGYPLDLILDYSLLISWNVHLFRLIMVILAFILIANFNEMFMKSRKIWTLFMTLSIAHTFYVIFFFTPTNIVILLLAWYVFFSIEPHYKKSTSSTA